MNDGSKMSFMEHLEELRKRLIRCVLAVFVGMIMCWFFREQILSFMLAPLYEAWRQVEGLPDPKPLNFSSMLEPFVAHLKLSAIGGLFLGAPVILYQIWNFIAPGLYPRERRLALPFVFSSTLLFVGGSVMAYSLVFPIGFRFFLDFAAGREMTELTAEVVVAAELDRPKPFQDAHGASIVLKKPATDNGIDAGTSGPEATADGGQNPSPQENENIGKSKPNPASTEEKTEDRSEAGNEPQADKEDSETWYGRIVSRLMKEECGVFEAATLPKGPGALLVFRWNVARCGELPSLDKIRRSGEKIAVDWKQALDDRPEYKAMNAEDRPLEQGKHVYTISVPENPGMKQLAPVLMVKDYLSFAIRLLLAFGLIFELPILISFLSLAGIVNYKQLLQFSKWFLVLSVVIGAMLTPPDVVTQILLALPLMILYFLSV
ncbi:MAG: hypothetical protein GY847_35415, partial [Proteobacteria bacterium]|nr:hypothetical protein [Pseudomonadota bacterium]